MCNYDDFDIYYQDKLLKNIIYIDDEFLTTIDGTMFKIIYIENNKHNKIYPYSKDLKFIKKESK